MKGRKIVNDHILSRTAAKYSDENLCQVVISRLLNGKYFKRCLLGGKLQMEKVVTSYFRL